MQGTSLGIRTRQLPEQVRQILLNRGLSEEMAEIAATKASGFGNKDGKEQKEPETAQMMFLTPDDIAAVAGTLYEAAVAAGSPAQFEKVAAKDLQDSAALKGWRPITPDIALFGRMITSSAFRDVEAAVQVAHAISTHKMEHEFDYFTAVDDLLHTGGEDDEKGAGMIGDVEFNSACYYKYASLDTDGLIENLSGPRLSAKNETEELEKAVDSARRTAQRTIMAFLKAAIFSAPNGKQNSFAAHQLPDGILIEVRHDKTPVSYANAFVKPVTVQRDSDLVDQSLLQFKNHVERITHKFSLRAPLRLWFTTRDTRLEGATDCETLDDLFARLTSYLEGQLSNG